MNVQTIARPNVDEYAKDCSGNLMYSGIWSDGESSWVVQCIRYELKLGSLLGT